MIRRVTSNDFEDTACIKKTLLLDNTKINDKKYRVATEKSGFFLYKKPQTKVEFAKDVDKIHFVYEEDGYVKGFLRIDEKQEMDNSIDTFWFKPELKEIYFSYPHAAMGGIGLLLQVAPKGIAKKLLESAVKELKKTKIHYLFSFEALSWMTNIVSMLFHERNNVERIAVCTVTEMFNLKIIKAFFMGKNCCKSYYETIYV